MSSTTKNNADGGVYECHLGYRCDRACVFCSLERLERSVPTARPAAAKMVRSLRAARGLGCSRVSFLGGEPTAGRLLERLVAEAVKAGFEPPAVYSDGHRFASLPYALRLASAGLGGVNLNLPSHEERVFDFLTGQQGGFKKVLKALANLARAGVPVSAVCVLNRLNVEKLPSYAAFYAARGVRAFTLNQLKFQGRLTPPLGRGGEALKVRMSDCVPGIGAMTAYCLEHGLCPPFLENFVPCAAGAYAGRAAGSAPVPAGGRRALSTHPETDGLSSLDLAGRDKVKFRSCRACVYSAGCPGVERSYVDIFGSGEFRPVTRRPAPFYSGLKGRKLALATAAFPQVMRRRPAAVR